MSTANFETMRDFPLYAKDYDDDYDSYIEVPLIEEDLADINYDLMFHKIQVKGGYYCGIQFYVDFPHFGLILSISYTSAAVKVIVAIIVADRKSVV